LTANRDTLLLRGKVFQFRLDVNSVKKPGVNVNSDKIIVTSPNEEHEKVRQILEIWYRKEAEKHFKDRLPLLADLVGKDIKTVSIRSQRTRWGSRSSRGTVSLNWRLIMAPDTVSDYVIYHELAHITQMNHSKRFWDLVETYCADYKTAERWLKEHHGLLKF
jgi:predicted metal-dependent hydrolase